MEQHERTVVDGTHHPMHVRHLTLRGTNYEIGCALGHIARERHGREPDTHLRGDPRYVRTRRHYLQQTYPLHCERMRGVAAAFGLAVDDDTYDLSALMYGMDVPPAPVLPEMPPIGCSVVYYPPATTARGSAYLSRNFDFSIGSIADVFGMPVPPDVELEPMVRHPYVLDTCATAEEAITAMLLVKQYYLLVPCHYIIGDRHGNSFVYENSTGRNIQYIVEGTGRPQVVTNFQLHQHLPREQMSSSDFSSLATESFWRYATLEEMLHQHDGGWSEDAMKSANACVSVRQMLEQLGADPANNSIPANMLSRTLWHSLYNVEQRTVAVDFYLCETGEGDSTKEIRSGYYEFALS
ncbi:MAG TPA: hypothetical protein VEZ12_05230 [Herpetosiphonaceae bacterium]|nr:hypothetical protein [Herpetosiphonaceae bacterium]